MLIETSLEKNYGTSPGEPVFGPDVQRFLVVEVRDPLLTASSGGGGGFVSRTFVNDETGETRTLPYGIVVDASGGDATVSTALADLISGALGTDGALQAYDVYVWIIGDNGQLFEAFAPERMWLPRNLQSSIFSIPYDTLEGPFLGRTGVTQTNEPGWDGQSLSIDTLDADQSFRYSFNPQGNVPFFTGLVNENRLISGDVTLVRPSQYRVAFEIFGQQAKVWSNNQVVVESFSWIAGDRFHIFYTPSQLKALVNTDVKWSS